MYFLLCVICFLMEERTIAGRLGLKLVLFYYSDTTAKERIHKNCYERKIKPINQHIKSNFVECSPNFFLNRFWRIIHCILNSVSPFPFDLLPFFTSRFLSQIIPVCNKKYWAVDWHIIELNDVHRNKKDGKLYSIWNTGFSIGYVIRSLCGFNFWRKPCSGMYN